MDIKDGIGRVMNNKKLYIRLLNKFNGKAMSDDVDAAVKSGEYAKITQAAHTLKGTAVNLGFKRLAAISAAIEAKAKGESPADALVPDLYSVLEATNAEIRRFLEQEG
jgi:HPt (histidine-containing phosphotransfer) domain-containing protein